MTIKIKSLDDVITYHKSNLAQWTKVVQFLDTALVNARDKRLAPIYLTKSRIKQPESAYLKFKRKKRDNPSKITDWIGLRVLCLFQQDIEPTFNLLIKLMLNRHQDICDSSVCFMLKEINIFNWPDNNAKKLVTLLKNELENSGFKKTIRDQPNGVDVAVTFNEGADFTQTASFSLKHERKGSGYQSVHFVVEVKLSSGNSVACEFQLRTLLQDVWAELEHALSYKKGKIHPHIRNSFQLLSTELQAKDILVSQLRDIRDEESAFAHYAHISSGPSKWFSYPAGFFDDVFNEADINTLRDYEEICHSRKKAKNPFVWREKTNEQLSYLISKFIDPQDAKSNYFVQMERAFLKFCAGDMSQAEHDYCEVISSEFGANEWFPYFRLGEVCLAQDKVEEALVAFDQCEEHMQKSTDKSTGADRYVAKIGLGYTYWSLGSEFLPTVIDKMNEAKIIVENYINDTNISDEEKDNLQRSLANNLCYYYLESWIDTPESSKVDEIHTRRQRASEQYEVLKELTLKQPEYATSNAYDTLAWYCYQSSLRASGAEEAEKFLETAMEFISAGDHLVNTAPSRLTSMSIQREHIQTIMSKTINRNTSVGLK